MFEIAILNEIDAKWIERMNFLGVDSNGIMYCID